jgi:hypothetical protein
MPFATKPTDLFSLLINAIISEVYNWKKKEAIKYYYFYYSCENEQL